MEAEAQASFEKVLHSRGKGEGMGRSLWRVLGKCLILIVLERLEQDVGPNGWRCSKFVRRSCSERDSYDRHIGTQWLSLAVFIREECEGWSLDLFAY